MEKEIKFIIRNPVDIAYFICKAAAEELDEIIEENEKRTQRFQKPLKIPKWNVKQMLENIDSLTDMTFSEPRFQEYAIRNPWDGKSSKKAWAEIAKKKLRDVYLLRIVRDNDDTDLFEQLCEIWPEMTPELTLTKEQRDELSNLQKQADDIVERAKGLVAEFSKLAEQEADIVRGTQSYCDTRISNQTKYVHVNMQYYKEHVKKW